jgi:glycosyltransferase involved in cell wall biosynthesis
MSVDVSIVIPLYNKDKFIIDTLKSICAQDFRNWECIIIDDGSTDSSLKVATDFCNAHSGNWKIYSIPNGGQTKARNVGISHATGRYLAFLDADDLWVTNKLSKQFEYLEANNEIIGVLSGYAIFNSKSKHFRVVINNNFDKMLENWASMRGFGGGLESVGMIRRNTNHADIMFDENLSTSSGLDFTIRCAQLGKMVLLREIGLLYRLSDGQWHTNIDELSSNMALIAQRYSAYFDLELHQRHLDYYFWIEVRKHGHKHLISTVLRDLTRFRFARLQMLLWLLSRNFKALWTGWWNHKLVRKQLEILKS